MWILAFIIFIQLQKGLIIITYFKYNLILVLEIEYLKYCNKNLITLFNFLSLFLVVSNNVVNGNDVLQMANCYIGAFYEKAKIPSKNFEN